MLKLVLTLVLSVSLSRWIYAEVQLLAPAALPALDYIVQRTEIPTHTSWSKDSFARVLAGVGKVVLLMQENIQAEKVTSHSSSVTAPKTQLSELEALLEPLDAKF